MAKSLSTLQYLDKALGGLRELGLLKGESDPVPIITGLSRRHEKLRSFVIRCSEKSNQAA